MSSICFLVITPMPCLKGSPYNYIPIYSHLLNGYPVCCFAPPLVLFSIDAMVINLKCNYTHITCQLKVFHAALQPQNEIWPLWTFASAPDNLSLTLRSLLYFYTTVSLILMSPQHSNTFHFLTFLFP